MNNPPVSSPTVECRAHEAWSRYWSSGALTSLPEDFAANYDAEIAAFWENQLSGLPDRCAVLDVCTGNGAVALLLASAIDGRDCNTEIVAIDAARIRPDLIEARYPEQAALVRRIRFIGDCALESADLPDQYFDLITSQYGIEYCDPTVAARRCAAWLKPGGHLAMICHAPDSAMRQTMQDELADYQRIERSGLLTHFRAYFGGSLTHAEFKTRLQAVRDALSGGGSRGPIIDYALALTDRALTLPESALIREQQMALDALSQLEFGWDRLEQMLEVNDRLADPERWVAFFTDAGLEAAGQGALKYRGRYPVGNWFRFRKPA